MEAMIVMVLVLGSLPFILLVFFSWATISHAPWEIQKGYYENFQWRGKDEAAEETQLTIEVEDPDSVRCKYVALAVKFRVGIKLTVNRKDYTKSMKSKL